MSLLRAYHARLGAAFAAVYVAVAVGVVAGVDRDAFFCIGPSNATFGSIALNTWPRWSAAVAYSATSQLADTLVSCTVGAYVTYVVKDHKCADKGGHCTAQTLVAVKTLFTHVAYGLDTALMLTMQAQFWAPAMLAELALGVFTTRDFLRRRGLSAPLAQNAVLSE